MSSLGAFARGLAWTATIGLVAFFYGYYEIASGRLGLWTIGALAVASIGIPPLFRGFSKGIALVNYEMCLLALWFGHWNGTAALGEGGDIQWFCISFLWPWAFFAAIGAIVVVVSSRKSDSPSCRTPRIAAAVLLAVAALVACGFAHLRLSEEQPVVAFRAMPFFLQGLAFSPDGTTLATVGGISRLDKNVRLWDAATGRALGECEKERADNGTADAAVQCCGNPPVVAASSYWYAFPRPDNKIVVQIWDLASQRPRKRLQWNDALELRKSVFSRDGQWFVYSNGNLRAFDLQAEEVVVDLKREGRGSVDCVAISAARDRLACATDEGELEIWDTPSGQLRHRVRTKDKVLCMDFTPDGRFLACGAESGKVLQIEIDGDVTREIKCFGHDRVEAIAHSPNGALLACAAGNEVSAKVIDVNRWTVVAELRTWGNWRTECLAFSSDSRRLVTGDVNGRVGVWDTAGWTDR